MERVFTRHLLISSLNSVRIFLRTSCFEANRCPSGDIFCSQRRRSGTHIAGMSGGGRRRRRGSSESVKTTNEDLFCLRKCTKRVDTRNKLGSPNSSPSNGVKVVSIICELHHPLQGHIVTYCLFVTAKKSLQLCVSHCSPCPQFPACLQNNIYGRRVLCKVEAYFAHSKKRKLKSERKIHQKLEKT